MRGTVRAAVPVALAALLAAGCGTARPPSAAPGHGLGAGGTSQPAAASGPVTITRAQAGRLARTLLARAVVPRGAHLLAGQAPAAVSRSPDWAAGSPSFGLHRIWTVSAPPSSVYSLVSKHVPTGLRWAGSGQSSAPTGVTQQFVSYSPGRLPAGVSQAILSMTVAPSGAMTLLRADVQVIWYPPRSPAEHIPAGLHVVTVTAWILGPGKPRTVSRTFTSAALAGRLAAMLNEAHAWVGVFVGCPLLVATYKVAFAASRTARPYLVAAGDDCGSVSITVSGRQQPALRTPDGFGQVLMRLTGRPADLPRSARIPPTQ